MHGAHVALGATFRDDGEWRIPEAYTSPREEARAALAAVGLADASACGKLQVRGQAAGALIAELAGIAPVAPGAAARVRLGGAEALACRLAPDELLVLTRPGDTAAVADRLEAAAAGAGCAHVADLTAGLAALDVVGPSAPRLLAKVVPLDLSRLPPLGVVQGTLARVPAVLIRLERPTVPAFRALVGRECGAFVWDALVGAGRELGLVPLGAAARALLEDADPLGERGR